MTASTSLANGTAVLNEICDELMTGNFYSGMHRLCAVLGLLRNEMNERDWTEFCRRTMAGHPIRAVLRQGPITGQWLRSPPGRGDCMAFDLACGRTVAVATATPLGRMLYRWEYGLPFSEALRSRRSVMARELNGIANEHQNAMVLSLGHSHIDEAAFPQVRLPGENFALDGGEERFDFIYSLDLFDTLDTVTATDLLPRLVKKLKPNGRLLAANLTPEIPEPAYLEAGMGHWPKYRSEEEMAKLAIDVPEGQVSSQCVFRDESGYTVLLEIQRSAD